MILKLEESEAKKDIEVLISYPERNSIVERIASFVKSLDSQVECHFDGGVKLVNASDIYYVEVIDRKTIVFCEDESYQIKNYLYQVLDKLESSGFIQINKYCILNINKLVKINTLYNSHLEAILSNGKCLNVTRNYLAGIKRLLLEDK